MPGLSSVKALIGNSPPGMVLHVGASATTSLLGPLYPQFSSGISYLEHTVPQVVILGTIQAP